MLFDWLSNDIFYCLLVFLEQIVEEAWRQFYEYYAVSWLWFRVTCIRHACSIHGLIMTRPNWTYDLRFGSWKEEGFRNIDRTLKWARPVVTRAAENSCTNRIIGVICPLAFLLGPTNQEDGW